MPHVIVEYPASAASAEQVESLLDAVHLCIVQSGLFDESHIKLRAVPLTHYRLGGKRTPFLHVQLRIHSGRSEQLKQQLSQGVLAALRNQQWPLAAITVEVVEMERSSYAKFSPMQGGDGNIN